MRSPSVRPRSSSWKLRALACGSGAAAGVPARTRAEAGGAGEASPEKSNSGDEPSDANADGNSMDSESPAAILAFLEGQPKGSISWVVSEYLERPLLLQPGDRKFDWRLWVLLQPDYTIRLYR